MPALLHKGKSIPTGLFTFRILRIKYVDAILKVLNEMEKHNHLSHQHEESNLKLDEDCL